MTLVVAHHFVINSGVKKYFDYSNITSNMVFLQLWGMWGKTAINVFVLITGYFMCTSKLTVKRVGKIFLEAKFYQILIFAVLFFAGYQSAGIHDLADLLFGYVRNPNNGFAASFLLFYLFIPFYNMLIQKMDHKQFRYLLGIALLYFTIVPTLLLSDSVFSEPLWYMILYFVAAYIRLYPPKWTGSNTFCGVVLIVTILVSYASVLAVDFVGVRFGFHKAYYMVSDSHHLFAFVIGVFAFLLFKNWNLKPSKVINQIAGTTFGVLCIHSASDAMRSFLWGDLLDVPGHFDLPLHGLILYSVASVVGVFTVCALIDMLRIHFIEKPLLRWLGKYQWFQKELY